MSNLTFEFAKYLKNSDIKQCGICLNKNWEYKKKLSSKISNKYIDNLYEKAMLSGAFGCKLLGAGQSGFLLIISDNHKKIKKSLNCDSFKLDIDLEGTKIIYTD